MRSGNRDDMVIRVRIPLAGDGQAGSQQVDEPTPPPTAARQAAAKRSLLNRLAKRRIVKRLAQRALSRTGLRGGGRLLANPVGATLAALAVAGAITARAKSGRSFENMGANLEYQILGDRAANSRASGQARTFLASNPMLANYVAAYGVTPTVRRVYQDLLRLRSEEERGRAMFMRDEAFQVNGDLDIFAVRTARAAVQAWNDSAGPKWLAAIGRISRGDATENDYRGDWRSIR